MALIRKEQKDISRLGPIGIIREAFELLLSHVNFFALVQIVLMLPLTVFVVASENLMYENLNSHSLDSIFGLINPGLPAHGHAHHLNLGAVLTIAFVMICGMGVVIPACFIYEVAMSLSSSVILYGVGLHYTSQSVSFQHALRASLQGSWMRLTITNVCKDLLLYLVLIVGVLILGFGLLLQNQMMMVLLLVTLVVFVFVAIVCLDIYFVLAAGVAVLEKLIRGQKLAGIPNVLDGRLLNVLGIPQLLEGRLFVAVLFELICWVPIGILVGFQLAFGIPFQITQKRFSPGNLTVSVLSIVIYIGLKSFLRQVKAVCGGVQYLSFNAYQEDRLDLESTSNQIKNRHEGLVFESDSKQYLNGGYELVASECGDAKGGVKQADTFLETDASV